jgi:hypothetical protein
MCSGTTDSFVAGEDNMPLPLDAVPMPAPTSTEPFVITDEGRAVLVYRIAPRDPNRAGPVVRNEEPFCLVRFDGAVFVSLGPPNDEEVSRHILHAKGLRPYAAYEVLKSTLVAEWWPDIASPIALRHFIFTFEDSSFEAVANSCCLVGTFATAEVARREAFLSSG